MVWLSSGCGHDWDAYDPRQGTPPSTGSGGASSGTTSGQASTGAGGASSTSSGSGSTSTGADAMCMPDQSRSCYDGPPGTETFGICKAGYQTCNVEGATTRWGPCFEQKLPVAEDCTTPADDDCDGKTNDHCGLWAKVFGDGDYQDVYGMAVDPASGQSVLVGWLEGSFEFAGATLQGAGKGDVVVLKVGADGTPLWGKRFGDAQTQYAGKVAFDSAGAVYLIGEFQGALSFGDAPELTLSNVGERDIYLAKLDASGNPLWARSFGNTLKQSAIAVTADAKGDVYVGGSFQGTIDFGDGGKVATEYDGFVVKLDGTTGATRWSRTFGSAGIDQVNSLAVDPQGNVVLGGVFTTAAVFGSTALTGHGGTDGVIGKFDPNGKPLWFRGYALGKDDSLSAVVDPSGNLVGSASLSRSVDFGCGKIALKSPVDIVVFKLDGAGKCLWNKNFGDPKTNTRCWLAKATDTSGNVLLSGALKGEIDFGGGLISSANDEDIVVLKLSPEGKLVWSRNFGEGNYQSGHGIGADEAGNVYVGFSIYGAADFGGVKVQESGSGDMGLLKLGP